MNIAVVLAGGSGIRAISVKGCPKQFVELNNKPIIIYTLEKYDNHPDIDAIVCVCLESYIPFLKKNLERFKINKVVRIIPGGKSGHESIFMGLCQAESYAAEINDRDTIVLIHDGVRPLITKETISENIKVASEYGSCITCSPIVETVIIDNHNESLSIPKRSDCRFARAPQTFYLHDIIAAHRKSQIENKCDFIDSCSLMSYYGKKLKLIDGPIENIKITTPSDFIFFRVLVEALEGK